MRVVEFKFNIDQLVRTGFGKLGIVQHLLMSRTNEKQYFIHFENGAESWVTEEFLVGIGEEETETIKSQFNKKGN